MFCYLVFGFRFLRGRGGCLKIWIEKVLETAPKAPFPKISAILSDLSGKMSHIRKKNLLRRPVSKIFANIIIVFRKKVVKNNPSASPRKRVNIFFWGGHLFERGRAGSLTIFQREGRGILFLAGVKVVHFLPHCFAKISENLHTCLVFRDKILEVYFKLISFTVFIYLT